MQNCWPFACQGSMQGTKPPLTNTAMDGSASPAFSTSRKHPSHPGRIAAASCQPPADAWNPEGGRIPNPSPDCPRRCNKRASVIQYSGAMKDREETLDALGSLAASLCALLVVPSQHYMNLSLINGTRGDTLIATSVPSDFAPKVMIGGAAATTGNHWLTMREQYIQAVDAAATGTGPFFGTADGGRTPFYWNISASYPSFASPPPAAFLANLSWAATRPGEAGLRPCLSSPALVVNSLYGDTRQQRERVRAVCRYVRRPKADG